MKEVPKENVYIYDDKIHQDCIDIFHKIHKVLRDMNDDVGVKQLHQVINSASCTQYHAGEILQLMVDGLFKNFETFMQLLLEKQRQENEEEELQVIPTTTTNKTLN